MKRPLTQRGRATSLLTSRAGYQHPSRSWRRRMRRRGDVPMLIVGFIGGCLIVTVIGFVIAVSLP